MSEKIVSTILILIALFVVLFPSFRMSELSETSEERAEESVNVSNEEYPLAEIPLEGFIRANISVDVILVDKAQVSLRAGCYLIEATTDACVANAIEKALKGKVDFRPTVYDVINDAFRNLRIKVLAVKITEIRENTFIGQLIIQQKDKVLALDIRPSDATAIALRAKAPIYINETLARERGRYIC